MQVWESDPKMCGNSQPCDWDWGANPRIGLGTNPRVGLGFAFSVPSYALLGVLAGPSPRSAKEGRKEEVGLWAVPTGTALGPLGAPRALCVSFLLEIFLR